MSQPEHNKRKVDPQTLAKYFAKEGFTTADKVPQPPPKARWTHDPADSPPPQEQVTPKDKERWPLIRRHAFDLLAPHALYVAASDGPVAVTLFTPGEPAKRFGHNRGCWPVKIGTTGSYRDTITSLVDKDPFMRIEVKRRVWLRGGRHANTLALHVAELLSEAAREAGLSPLRSGYIDAGPEFNVPKFEVHILEVAKRLEIPVWTEEQLSLFLDDAISRAKAKGIEILDPRGRKVMHQGFVHMVDRMVERTLPGVG